MTKKRKQSSPTIVITGAGGYIGSFLVGYFADKGWQVRGMVREPAKHKKQENITYAAYDLTMPPDETLFSGADYLIHLAYIKSDSRNPRAFTQNISGAKQILSLTHKLKIKKTIFMSSLSAQPDAVSSYGKQKYRIEKLFKAKNEVSVRSGLVIGDGGLLKQTVNFMKSKHVMPLIDGGKQPLQIIALYDLAAAMEGLLVSTESGSYTIASPRPYTYRSVYRIIAEKLKIRVTFIPVPFIIPQTILRTVQILHLPFPVNEDNLLGLQKLRYQDTTADLQKLGLRVDDLETALTKLALKLK